MAAAEGGAEAWHKGARGKANAGWRGQGRGGGEEWGHGALPQERLKGRHSEGADLSVWHGHATKSEQAKDGKERVAAASAGAGAGG